MITRSVHCQGCGWDRFAIEVEEHEGSGRVMRLYCESCGVEQVDLVVGDRRAEVRPWLGMTGRSLWA
jgi:hypothetical protein